MIEIPKIAKPDSGMVFRKPIWYAVFYVDNKTRTRSLGTGDKTEARAARDAFFASLAAQGAATRSVRTKAAAGSDAYIHERPQFVVRVPGRKLRYAASIEHAREIRDEMLGENVPAVAPATLEPESTSDVMAG